jgi:hypothetical protein
MILDCSHVKSERVGDLKLLRSELTSTTLPYNLTFLPTNPLEILEIGRDSADWGELVSGSK